MMRMVAPSFCIPPKLKKPFRAVGREAIVRGCGGKIFQKCCPSLRTLGLSPTWIQAEGDIPSGWAVRIREPFLCQELCKPMWIEVIVHMETMETKVKRKYKKVELAVSKIIRDQ
jgi:hypothetical protein